MATATRRKTGKNKTTGRRKASPAQVAAAQARDAERQEIARAAMSRPDFGARVVAMVGAAPSLSRFSVRNQALLLEFSEKAGRPAEQVATYNQWAAMGRQVRRGESAYLWVVRPLGRTGDEVPDNETPEQRAERFARQDDTPTKFGFMRQFDISQTDGIDDFTPEQEGRELIARDAAAINDPVGTILEQVGIQARRLGYTFTHSPDGEGVQFDTDTNTLALCGEPTPDRLEHLLSAIGGLTVARDREREAAREARKAAKAAEGTGDTRTGASVAVGAEDGDTETFSVF